MTISNAAVARVDAKRILLALPLSILIAGCGLTIDHLLAHRA